MMTDETQLIPPQFVLFGDSLTQRGFETDKQGWAASLANDFIRRVDVINRGFSGYNTEWCRHVLPFILRALSATPVALFTIFLGANDAVLPGFRQYVPVQRYQENLLWMIDQIRSAFPRAKILLLTPPAVYPPDWEAHCHQKGRDLDRCVDHTKLYVNACREVYQMKAADKNMALVDIYSEMERYTGSCFTADTITQWQNVRSLLCDGLHFSAEGNQMLYQLVKKTIVKQFPELDPERMTHFFPWHDQINLDHPEQSVRPYGDHSN